MTVVVVGVIEYYFFPLFFFFLLNIFNSKSKRSIKTEIFSKGPLWKTSEAFITDDGTRFLFFLFIIQPSFVCIIQHKVKRVMLITCLKGKVKLAALYM